MKNNEIKKELEEIVNEANAKLLAEMRKTLPNQLAEELLSVQPMDNDVVSDLYKVSMTETELKEQGYKPVSNMGLMWTKNS